MPVIPPKHPDEILTSPGQLLGDSPAAEVSNHRTLLVETTTTLRVRRCRLAVTSGPSAGKEIVSEKERIRVGTHSTNDLALEDRTVSRHHCELSYTDKGYLLTDLDSTNGTLLDGKRIVRAYLQPGSTIKVGQSSLTFSPIDEEIVVEPDSDGVFCGMVGRSMEMRQIFGLIKKIAPMDVSVIIQGETGTGKEMAAKAIHECSARRKGPFEVLDCGAIPPDLVESELFGHEKGAFTGAISSRPGIFERAHGGTIFLDEIGELRVDLQPKLLRVLENRELRRVGGNDVIEVDVRVIAATHRDLMRQIEEEQFREDLYFRLSVINIQLPALRQRKADLPHLIKALLAEPEVVRKHGAKRLSSEAMALMSAYSWPGNVRELVNVLSHLLTFCDGELVEPNHLPARLLGKEKSGPPLPFNEHLPFKAAKEALLDAFEREYIGSLLKRCQGNISQAARESGMHRKSIERLAKKYGFDARAIKAEG